MGEIADGIVEQCVFFESVACRVDRQCAVFARGLYE